MLIYKPTTSEKIFQDLKEEIELVKKKEKLFKRRWIDTSIIYKTGKYINWIEVMENEKVGS